MRSSTKEVLKAGASPNAKDGAPSKKRATTKMSMKTSGSASSLALIENEDAKVVATTNQAARPRSQTAANTLAPTIANAPPSAKIRKATRHAKPANVPPSEQTATIASAKTKAGSSPSATIHADRPKRNAQSTLVSAKSKRTKSVTKASVTASASTPILVDQSRYENRRVNVDETSARDQGSCDNHSMSVAGAHTSTLVLITHDWRLRKRWHRAEKALVLQAKALLRSFYDGDKEKAAETYDKAAKPFTVKQKSKRPADPVEASRAAVGDELFMMLDPFISSSLRFAEMRAPIEAKYEKLAETLPIWKLWGVHAKGFGAGTLASILAESFSRDPETGAARDLGTYKSVAALWKRFGLAVIGGRRQRMVAGDAALEQGYSPERRSLIWNLVECVVKAQIRTPPDAPEDTEDRVALGPWGQLYLERREHERAVCAAIAADPERLKTMTTTKKKNGEPAKYAPNAHANNRAKRFLGKRILRELYAAWRAIERGEQPRPPGQSSIEDHREDAGRDRFFGHAQDDVLAVTAEDRPGYEARENPTRCAGAEPIRAIDLADTVVIAPDPAEAIGVTLSRAAAPQREPFHVAAE